MVRTSKRRCHTVTSSAFASFKAEQAGSAEASQQETIASSVDAGGVRRRTRRSKTLGAEIMKEMFVSVVGPGGGTGINASVYAALAKKEGFSVNILGQSRAPYDRYPASWAKEGGAPAPNLESFALDLLNDRSIENVDCLVVGSRGGQVVLPTFWEGRGAAVPPTVVMNGGCAMNLPTVVHWPETAVSFLLLGGQDYFRGQLSIVEYMKDAQRRVPDANSTTAILLVNEMTHMPQAQLLTAILHLMIRAATSWKRSGDIPMDDFQTILRNLRKGAWSGNLSFKSGSGDVWQHEAFP
jgi:hypothetical protein